MQTIDIICPVFEEEETIGLFHAKLSSIADELSSRYSCRIFYVVDPSRDRTEAILRDICSSDSRVELLVMSRRFGHQLALIAGMDHSRGDAIVMLDSDLQHPPELITQLVEIWKDGADVVQCVRQGDPEQKLRRLMSRWFYRIFLQLGDVALPVGAADYRLLSRRVVDVLRVQVREHNPFLRGLVSWVGFKIVYVPFTPVQRKRGKTKYSAPDLINFALNGICSFSKVPLRFCIAAGCMLAVMSILSAMIELAIYFFFEAIHVPGWASLFATVSFVGGIQLIFLGVVGEYIGLIFDEVKNRPRYVLDCHYQSGRLTLVRDERGSTSSLNSEFEGNDKRGSV